MDGRYRVAHARPAGREHRGRRNGTTGNLDSGQGSALLAKLDAATRQLNQGKPQTAMSILTASISQCEAYVAAGILTPAAAQPLIDAARVLIAAL